MNKLKEIFNAVMATFIRIGFIFVILSITVDSMTRIYFSYMPLDTWIDFQSVTVTNDRDQPVVVVTRKAVSRSISVFHRTLLIRYPEERRGCTNSTVTILDDPTITSVVVPLDRILSDNCAKILGDKPTNAMLQVSYIFEFPYGVKRATTRYSNQFSIYYDGKGYHVAKPLSDDELSKIERGPDDPAAPDAQPTDPD